MSPELEEEIKEVAEKLKIDCFNCNSIRFITDKPKIELEKFVKGCVEQRFFTAWKPDTSNEFKRHFHREYKWAGLSSGTELSEDAIRKHHDVVDWYRISHAQKMSDDFIREFKDKINWGCLPHKNMSLGLIRDFPEKLNWNYISIHHNLSEETIEEFEEYVDWRLVSYHQNLSNEFIVKWQNKLDAINLSNNHRLDIENLDPNVYYNLRELWEVKNMPFSKKFKVIHED